MSTRYRVLVTGVGGGVGQSVVKSLKGTFFDCVGYDSSPLAAGLYMTDNAWLGLNANHPDYIYDVMSAATKFGCKFIIPGHDVELLPLVRAHKEFDDNGITLLISNLSLIELADDKYMTSQKLKNLGFDTPETWNFREFDWQDVPVVIKPRKGGARSKGTYFAHTQEEFLKHSQNVDPNNAVVQEFCPGDEYTCGTLTIDGNFRGSISMKRELRGGDTYKATSIKVPEITDTLEKLCSNLKPNGPCNFQLKYHDGRVRVFEINARFSGTTYMRKLCGFDEVLYTLNSISGQPIPSLDWREITILRYWSELIVENSDLKSK